MTETAGRTGERLFDDYLMNSKAEMEIRQMLSLDANERIPLGVLTAYRTTKQLHDRRGSGSFGAPTLALICLVGLSAKADAPADNSEPKEPPKEAFMEVVKETDWSKVKSNTDVIVTEGTDTIAGKFLGPGVGRMLKIRTTGPEGLRILETDPVEVVLRD